MVGAGRGVELGEPVVECAQVASGAAEFIQADNPRTVLSVADDGHGVGTLLVGVKDDGSNRDGLATAGRGVVTVHDLPGLRRLAEFDPAYLYLSDSLRTP